MDKLKIAKYHFDCVTNTLYLSDKFYERAGQFNSGEYNLLQMMKQEIPGLRVQVQARKKRRTPNEAHLSIKAMRHYISLTKDKDRGLKELEKAIDANAGKDHPLKETRRWFRNRYPTYDEIPRFDSDGYLILDRQEGGDEE